MPPQASEARRAAAALIEIPDELTGWSDVPRRPRFEREAAAASSTRREAPVVELFDHAAEPPEPEAAEPAIRADELAEVRTLPRPQPEVEPRRARAPRPAAAPRVERAPRAPRPARPPRRPAERLASAPDRAALWAFLMAICFVLIAVLTAN